MCGNSGVGKTSIISKYINGTLPDKVVVPTISVELCTKIITLRNGTQMKAQIWDTAGQEKYQSLSSNYFKRSQGILIVFDITNKNSFNDVKNWVKMITDMTNEKCILYLVGNKKDLEDKRQVSVEAAKKFSKENGITKYIETSIFDNDNTIDKVFFDLLYNIDKMQSMTMGKYTHTQESQNRSMMLGGNNIQSNQKMNVSYNTDSNLQCSCC